MMRRSINYFLVLLGIVLCASCNNTRKLPAGEALYTGAAVKLDGPGLSRKKKKNLRGELSGMTRPRPNKKILGVRFKLSMYNLAGNPKKENSPAGWLKNKVGEPPVLLSELNLEHNQKVLQSYLENTGYFHARVTGDTTIRKKKAKATYTVETGPQYLINEVVFVQDSGILTRTIDSTSANTLLKKDEPFDIGVIKAERVRIDAYLKERGFYFFDPDYLVIRTDSTIGNHKVNLYVTVKPVTPPEAREVYRINDVFIFPSYRLNASTTSVDTLKKDAIFYEGYYVVDRRKLYKPKMFDDAMKFEPGDVYSRKDQNLSISRLVNLGVFKFVKNRFEVVPGDSALLNTYYYLTPMPKKSLRSEINASTKSNNLTGSSITVGWRNRNTFRGGELFSIDATGGFEVQFSGQFRGYNTIRGGIEANMSFPRFLTPLFSINTPGGFSPRTNILLAYDLLNKQKLYTMNSFRAGFGYIWKESIFKEHQFNPIAITYAQPLLVTKLYSDSSVKQPTLLKAIERQFILGSNYNYNYNQLQVNDKRTGFYFNGNIDLSGNIAGLLMGADAKGGKPKSIFGAQFSQYVKLEGDIRHYTRVGPNTIWANRVIAGFGLPYGNSESLPFIKQFFIGGTNSIRAFRSRSIGPGSYIDTLLTTFLPDQSGDIKLEINTELRQKLFSIVHGALFIDAGNIWLYNKDENKPGAEFSKDFMKQLAVGGGVGLRFDISFLVLRLDAAIPLRKPWIEAPNKWVLKDIRFRDREWRKNNIVFNLGIGYPF